MLDSPASRCRARHAIPQGLAPLARPSKKSNAISIAFAARTGGANSGRSRWNEGPLILLGELRPEPTAHVGYRGISLRHTARAKQKKMLAFWHRVMRYIDRRRLGAVRELEHLSYKQLMRAIVDVDRRQPR